MIKTFRSKRCVDTVIDSYEYDETDDCEVNISGGGALAAPSAVPPLAPTICTNIKKEKKFKVKVGLQGKVNVIA